MLVTFADVGAPRDAAARRARPPRSIPLAREPPARERVRRPRRAAGRGLAADAPRPSRASGRAHCARAKARCPRRPSTRRLARELGVDLRAVRGSGPGGRVTDDDVRAPPAATRATRPAPHAPARRPPRRRWSAKPLARRGRRAAAAAVRAVGAGGAPAAVASAPHDRRAHDAVGHADSARDALRPRRHHGSRRAHPAQPRGGQRARRDAHAHQLPAEGGRARAAASTRSSTRASMPPPAS